MGAFFVAAPRFNWLGMITLQELSEATRLTESALRARLGEHALVRVPGGRVCVPRLSVRDLLLSNQSDSFAPKVVTFVSLKGGVGKTTSAITFAVRSAQYGWNTCVMDLDAQASATLAFDAIPEVDAPLFCDLWGEPDGMTEAAVVPIQDGLSLLPSALENGMLDTALADPSDQLVAARGVAGALTRNGHELIVIDCPPSLGTATISAICAADIIVVPLVCDPYSVNAVQLTLKEIAAIQDNYRIPEPQVMLLVSRFDRRERIGSELLEELMASYPDKIVARPIPVSTEFNRALAERQTIFDHHRSSTAKREYDLFVRTLLGLHVGEGSPHKHG